MSILKRYEIRPGLTLKLSEEDYRRMVGELPAQTPPEPSPPAMVRVEVEPGMILNLTPEDAQKVREERDRRRAAAAAALVARAVDTGISLDGCGVVLTSESETAAARLCEMGLQVISGGASEVVPFERTLLWDPAAPLRLDLIPNGFHLITRFAWQIAAPIWSYEQLARDIGSAEDRARTEAVIRDLRVPVYDCRVLFLRRCAEVEQLLEAWREECQLPEADGREHEASGRDDALRLACMRALYRVRPLICALPVTWVGK